MSLRAFAAAVDVSPGLISQIENGRAQPSMATLFSIVSALGISYDELLGSRVRSPASARQDVELQRAADAPELELGNGVRWKRLSPGRDSQPDAVMVTYAPGAFTSSQGDEVSHSGTEFVVVLEGRLALRLDGDLHDLEAGDSIRFDAARPHVYRNEDEIEARGLWLVTSSPRALQLTGAAARKRSASSTASRAELAAPSEVVAAQAITPSGRTSTAPSDSIP